MFSTPEIYLQAELQYHRDQVRSQFGRGRLQRQGKAVRRSRAATRLARPATTSSAVSQH